MEQLKKPINMKKLFLIIFVLISLNIFSQSFDFNGTFQLSSQNDYDFDKVKIEKYKFFLINNDDVISEYIIIGEDPKIGYKMINTQDNTIIYVFPILINNGKNLKVHLYDSKKYSTLHFEKSKI